MEYAAAVVLGNSSISRILTRGAVAACLGLCSIAVVPEQLTFVKSVFAKIGPQAAAHLETVRGVGYLFRHNHRYKEVLSVYCMHVLGGQQIVFSPQ